MPNPCEPLLVLPMLSFGLLGCDVHRFFNLGELIQQGITRDRMGSRPKSCAKCCTSRGLTSSVEIFRESSFSSDVAFRSAIPHGTIKSK